MRTLYIGIDAGGSQTRLAFRRSPRDKPQFMACHGINLQRDGLESAASALVSCISRILDVYPDRVGTYAICAGVAGAGLPADRDALSNRLRDFLSDVSAEIRLTTDVDIAFRAAFGDGAGTLIIAGTGVILWVRTPAGKSYRAGGWGSLLGDDGGGYKIGLAGLRALVDSMDGGPETRLCQTLGDEAGLNSKEAILDFAYRKRTPLQHITPIVLKTAEAGDRVAQEIVRGQVDAVALRYRWLAGRVDLTAMRVALWGGVLQNAYYRARLVEAIQQQNPDVRFITLAVDPAEAALLWAEEGGELEA